MILAGAMVHDPVYRIHAKLVKLSSLTMEQCIAEVAWKSSLLIVFQSQGHLGR